jgi:hypothetical protein
VFFKIHNFCFSCFLLPGFILPKRDILHLRYHPFWANSLLTRNLFRCYTHVHVMLHYKTPRSLSVLLRVFEEPAWYDFIQPYQKLNTQYSWTFPFLPFHTRGRVSYSGRRQISVTLLLVHQTPPSHTEVYNKCIRSNLVLFVRSLLIGCSRFVCRLTEMGIFVVIFVLASS